MGSKDLFFPTFSGKRIDLMEIDPTQIDMGDIALGLSKNARWGGQTRGVLSGAEHCVRLSHLVPERVAGLALMHDAPEYVMCDLSRPVKMLIPQYADIEARFLKAILTKYGLLWTLTTPEARDMWQVDEVFPVVEKRFSGMFTDPLGDNISTVNGIGDTNQNYIRYLATATILRWPEWGWGQKLAEERFLKRVKELHIC